MLSTLFYIGSCSDDEVGIGELIVGKDYYVKRDMYGNKICYMVERNETGEWIECFKVLQFGSKEISE